MRMRYAVCELSDSLFRLPMRLHSIFLNGISVNQLISTNPSYERKEHLYMTTETHNRLHNPSRAYINMNRDPSELICANTCYRVGPYWVFKGALYIIWCGVNRLGDSGVKVV